MMELCKKVRYISLTGIDEEFKEKDIEYWANFDEELGERWQIKTILDWPNHHKKQDSQLAH